MAGKLAVVPSADIVAAPGAAGVPAIGKVLLDDHGLALCVAVCTVCC